MTPWPSDGGELSCAGRRPPTSHLTSLSGPHFHFSHTHTDTRTHTHHIWSHRKLSHNLKHIIESCSCCNSAAKSNLYAGGRAWSDETSCYFAEGGRKSHSHNCLGERALREYHIRVCVCVCVCVCVFSHIELVCLSTYCSGSLQCCCSSRSSTTAAGWRLWSLTGCSSLLRYTTRSEPDTSPRHDVRTRSASVCLQKKLKQQSAFFKLQTRNYTFINGFQHFGFELS